MAAAVEKALAPMEADDLEPSRTSEVCRSSGGARTPEYTATYLFDNDFAVPVWTDGGLLCMGLPPSYDVFCPSPSGPQAALCAEWALAAAHTLPGQSLK